ncbi:PML protein, partial [Atractosteus spatula]|nr:PML protein [Atractosteus spatula]
MNSAPDTRRNATQSQSEYTLVFFDLETTGLDVAACDIVQLSAISGEETFNLHMVPRCRMTDEASRITGFTVQGQALLLHGGPVNTVTHREALSSFIDFLRTFHRPLLVAHNAKRFDCPVLSRALDEFSLKDEFQQVVAGFLDTFLLGKELLAASKVTKYSQQYLVKLFLHKTYMAHNALEDVRALQELYNKWNPAPAMVCKQRFSL